MRDREHACAFERVCKQGEVRCTRRYMSTGQETRKEGKREFGRQRSGRSASQKFGWQPGKKTRRKLPLHSPPLTKEEIPNLCPFNSDITAPVDKSQTITAGLCPLSPMAKYLPSCENTQELTVFEARKNLTCRFRLALYTTTTEPAAYASSPVVGFTVKHELCMVERPKTFSSVNLLLKPLGGDGDDDDLTASAAFPIPILDSAAGGSCLLGVSRSPLLLNVDYFFSKF